MRDDEAHVAGEEPPEDPLAGRRQADALTAAELRANPAWWFPGGGRHLHGPDDATVLPIDAGAAAEDGSVEFPPGRYLLHAEFVLADGTRVDGHVTFAPGDDGSVAAREPTIVAARGQLALFLGALPRSRAELDADLARVGLAGGRVFPLRWTATLHPPEKPLTGELAGFVAWSAGQ